MRESAESDKKSWDTQRGTYLIYAAPSLSFQSLSNSSRDVSSLADHLKQQLATLEQKHAEVVKQNELLLTQMESLSVRIPICCAAGPSALLFLVSFSHRI